MGLTIVHRAPHCNLARASDARAGEAVKANRAAAPLWDRGREH